MQQLKLVTLPLKYNTVSIWFAKVMAILFKPESGFFECYLLSSEFCCFTSQWLLVWEGGCHKTWCTNYEVKAACKGQDSGTVGLSLKQEREKEIMMMLWEDITWYTLLNVHQPRIIGRKFLWCFIYLFIFPECGAAVWCANVSLVTLQFLSI